MNQLVGLLSVNATDEQKGGILQRFGYEYETKATGGNPEFAAEEVYAEHPYAWVVGYPFEEPVGSFTYFYPESWIVNKEYYSRDRCPLDADGLPRLVVTPVDGRCPGDYDFDFTGQPVHIPDGPFPELPKRGFEIDVTYSARAVIGGSIPAQSARLNSPTWTSYGPFYPSDASYVRGKAAEWYQATHGGTTTEEEGSLAFDGVRWFTDNKVQCGEINCYSTTVIEGSSSFDLNMQIRIRGVYSGQTYYAIKNFTHRPTNDPKRRKYTAWAFKKWSSGSGSGTGLINAEGITVWLSLDMLVASHRRKELSLGENRITPTLTAFLEAEYQPSLQEFPIEVRGDEAGVYENIPNPHHGYPPPSANLYRDVNIGTANLNWKVTLVHTQN